MQRRRFIRNTSLAGASLMTSGLPTWSKFNYGSDDDIALASAMDAAQAIRAGKISSVELTRLMLERQEKFNSELNAIIYPISDEALAVAKKADEDLAKGIIHGPLHGVPITIKDSFNLKGTPTTWGMPFAKNNIAQEDAVAVARLKAAGAVVLGHTNVPVMLGDHQSFNDIYGRSNNPWDLERTPGGSTGGGAAALASGMSYLSLGSDIGGSIRVPASFCGAFGHKPTIDLVPQIGHQPPIPDIGPPISYGLPVCGPLARSAGDLMTAMSIVGGPAGDQAIAYSWKMPEPRKTRLQDFRIRYVLDDPNCPVSSEIRPVMERAIKAFRAAGVRLEEGWPNGMDSHEQINTYSRLLGAFFAYSVGEDEIKAMREGLPEELKTADQYYVKGQSGLHRDFLIDDEKRLKFRQQWQLFFKDYDAMLTPTAFIPAFPHTTVEWTKRVMETPDGQRRWDQILYWISIATLTGLPATNFPVGISDTGLPVGMQLMGPFLEDATPIALAGMLSEVVGMPEWPGSYR